MIILVVNHACIDRPPFLFIDCLAAYIKPASESMRAPLHRWWTHRSNSNLDVWLVGE